MSTFVYMVRHGESPKEGNERTRGLTAKGQLDIQQVTALLKSEEIDIVASSPYVRSLLTVEKVAEKIGKEVLVFEDLKEREFSSQDNRLADKKLAPLLERSFVDPNYVPNGGESNAECQKRAVKVLNELLITYKEKSIVIGTHGVVMTLMMGFYESEFDLDFLNNLSKPDIYKMEFNGQDLLHVQRLWDENY